MISLRGGVRYGLVSPRIERKSFEVSVVLLVYQTRNIQSCKGFLVHFESEVLRRAQKNFSFRNGSIGNYFLAAARIFFRSLPSAIFLFSSITTSQACRFEASNNSCPDPMLFI